uniref:Uncharacterized protein n=1 Tax=Avena sativa TaxID=4498 RepID=A0ACD5UJ09_AVESA
MEADAAWIITGEEKGHVRIWNYKTQKKIYSFRLSESSPVKLVKFIERKQWFAAGAHYYYSSIHVYSYETIMQKIMSISVAELGSLMSLAVHPTKPYLLSVHHQWHTIIWNWDKNWQRTEILGGDWLEKCQSAFSSQDTVAIPSSRGTVKVLSLDSPESNYTLSGHSERVNCLIFFTRDDQEYLVTGSDDLTAKIWDMQKKICLNTLRCMSAVMSILYRPDLQILITGSKNGDVHLWRTAGCRTYSRYPRLKGTVNIGHGVHSLACLMGRVLVGKKDGVAVMDIDNVCYGEESTYYSEPELREDMKPTNDETSKVIAGSSSELPTLDVHPLELCFPYAPNMSICCPLELTNTTNERAAFRLMDKSAKTELYDIVPPKSTYTLIVTREENSSMKLVGETEFHLLLQSCTLGDRYIVMFTSQSECDDFFEEAQELGNNVHEVTLKCVYVPQGDLMFKALLVSRGIKIISVKSTDEELCSIYAHPTEGWIITGHANGDVRSWKHGMKKPMNSFKTSERSGIQLSNFISSCTTRSNLIRLNAVCSIKFVAKRKWIVAGAYDGVIHVFDCARVTKMQRITSFPSTINWYPYTISLAVHPANTYVLSTTMEIWNGNENWKRIHNFEPIDTVAQVAFNPKDVNIFATGSCYGAIKVWNIVSDYHDSYPRGHTEIVNCLDFYTRGGRQYLISGSSDCTAKIWDMQEAVCIHTLDIMSPVISVIPLPHRPYYIVTGSNHGTVQLWSSTDFSLTRTVNFGGGGPVRGLCSMGSRSVVIGQEKRITIMDIDKDAATWKKIFPLSLNNPPKIFSSIKETLIDTVSPCSRFSS